MNRKYILQEIKRTAEANDGVPLGWRKFLSETGIKESDWLGKYWARWSDAVREAGFMPNKLQSAYEDSELLEKYARFTCEIGRLPTDGDLRLKTNSDPDFPSDKPYRRFGTKSDLVRKLFEYSRTHEGYDEVTRLCEEYTPKTRDEAEEPKHGGDEEGFVYLIKSGRFYKIGKTNAAKEGVRDVVDKLK